MKVVFYIVLNILLVIIFFLTSSAPTCLDLCYLLISRRSLTYSNLTKILYLIFCEICSNACNWNEKDKVICSYSITGRKNGLYVCFINSSQITS